MPKTGKKIVLIGGGGHSRVVLDAIRKMKGYDVFGIIDSRLKKGSSVMDAKVLGSDGMLAGLFTDGIKHAFITVGSIGNCNARKKIYENLNRIGFDLPVIVHPKAVVACDVKIKEGTFVAAGAVINPGVKIGRNVIINTSSSVDHDCVIGDFAHIGPGVTLSGGVKIGDETHVGTGANVIQYVSIGNKCLVGAGSTIREDVRDEERVLTKFRHDEIE